MKCDKLKEQPRSCLPLTLSGGIGSIGGLTMTPKVLSKEISWLKKARELELIHGTR